LPEPPGRRDVVKGPVITAVPAGHPGAPTIPFGGLVEATVVQAFRRTELPLQRIRRALEVLRAGSVAVDYGVPVEDIDEAVRGLGLAAAA
jgi:hypothetical protein